jgi:hypothetical protein
MRWPDLATTLQSILSLFVFDPDKRLAIRLTASLHPLPTAHCPANNELMPDIFATPRTGLLTVWINAAKIISGFF